MPKSKAKSCTNLSAQEILGHKVRDVISGFEGNATGHVIYVSGCTRVLVSPDYNKKKNEWPNASWLDDQRLEIVPGSVQIRLDNAKKPGHDEPPPVR